MPLIREAGGSLELTLSAGSNNIKPLQAAGKLEQGAKRGENVVRPAKRRAETKRWNQEKRYKARSNHAQIIFHAHVFPQYICLPTVCVKIVSNFFSWHLQSPSSLIWINALAKFEG